jgi:hypothetical protein
MARVYWAGCASARSDAVDLVKFIDAHGGRLAPFRAYQQVRPPSASPTAPTQ